MIRFISINIRSINKRKEELSNLMKNENIDFAFVQETFHHGDLTKIPGFKSIGNYRNKNGGGVAIYSRSKTRLNPIYTIYSNKNSKIEGIGEIIFIDKHKLDMYSI